MRAVEGRLPNNSGGERVLRLRAAGHSGCGFSRPPPSAQDASLLLD